MKPPKMGRWETRPKHRRNWEIYMWRLLWTASCHACVGLWRTNGRIPRHKVNRCRPAWADTTCAGRPRPSVHAHRLVLGPCFDFRHPRAEDARPCSSSRAACVKSKQDTSETPRASPKIPNLASIRYTLAQRTSIPAPHHGQHAPNRSRTPRKFVAHPPESRTSLQFGTPSRRGRPPPLLITGREARLRGSYPKGSECSLSITGRGASQGG